MILSGRQDRNQVSLVCLSLRYLNFVVQSKGKIRAKEIIVSKYQMTAKEIFSFSEIKPRLEEIYVPLFTGNIRGK